MTRRVFSAASLAVFAFVAAPSQAALVEMCSDVLCYVYDDEQPALDLMGQPVLDGDSLEFNIPDLRAESASGAGTDIVVANFVATVRSLTDANIVSVDVNEFLDYNVVNFNEVSDENARVDAQLRISLNNIAGSGQSSELWTFHAMGDSDGQQSVNLMGVIEPAFASGHIQISIQNVLTAFTDELGELAWIQKKFSIVTTVIPVPAAVWLFASGLGFLGFVRRRLPR